MPVSQHDQLPVHDVPRIRTRILASQATGAAESSVWEQWIEPDGHIPLHFHDTEELLVILAGDVSLTINGETTTVEGPATIIAPAGQVHGLRSASESTVHLLAFFPTATPKIFSPDGSERPLPWKDFGSSERPP